MSNKINIDIFSNVIRKAWTKDTCYEPWQDEWSKNNPSKGQCYVTAKVFQNLFGGSLIKAKDSNGFSHYWNILDGIEYDFTKYQYPENEQFTNREVIDEVDSNERVELLTKNLFKKILEHNGFPIIYEWYDEPNTEYPEHKHDGKVSFFILDGSVTFTSGITTTISQYERIDVPIGVNHTAIVGPRGCRYIVGQVIEGDA